MENNITFLLELKSTYLSRYRELSKTCGRLKIGLFVFSIAFLGFYHIDVRIKEYSILGLKIDQIDLNKMIFLIPLVITFLFSYHTLHKLNAAILALRTEAVTKEIEIKTGVHRESIFKKNPYISDHGTLYDFTERDRFYTMGIKVSNILIWAPVIYVFIFSSRIGFQEAVGSNDRNFLIFYSITIATSFFIIILMQLSKSLSFRKAKIQKPGTEIKEKIVRPL